MSQPNTRPMRRESLLDLAPYTRQAKLQQRRQDAQREQLCHPLFAGPRYAIMVEVDVFGRIDPVLSVVLTAPNIRAARSKAIEHCPGHIRRFLDWKLLPLYPLDDKEVA